MRAFSFSGLAVLAVLALTPGVVVAAPRDEAACAKLRGFVLASGGIGLPSGGAKVSSSNFVAATPQKTEPGPGGRPRTVLARPDRCEVKGEIAPIDPAAPVIEFQVNLPVAWNGKTVQMGGGGFNGNLQTGLGALPRSPDTLAYPLSRGFVTYGSDGGHQGEGAAFGLNAEALTNFIDQQTKKTHDVAMALVRARYGRAPQYRYFVGQSEGGREGLMSAQQHPDDYDGIVATAPAIHYVDSMFRLNDVGTAISRPGGHLNLAEIKTFADAVLAQCDMNDGVADRIIGNYLGCHFDPSVLRCPRGQDTADTCLSDVQLDAIATMYHETVHRDAKGEVVARYPRYLLGGGEELQGALLQWTIGRAPMPRYPPSGEALKPQELGVSTAAFYGNSMIRYFITRNPAFDSYDFDVRPYAEPARAIVARLSNDNPNLSAFKNHGGKLILLHNTSDAALSAVSTMNYFDAVTATLGKEATLAFARLYVVPGGDHGGNGTASKVDLLGMLDGWVANGKAPNDEWIAEEDGPDMKPIRTKPLCSYPYYPHYRGAGDPKAATSYGCVVARP